MSRQPNGNTIEQSRVHVLFRATVSWLMVTDGSVAFTEEQRVECMVHHMWVLWRGKENRRRRGWKSKEEKMCDEGEETENGRKTMMVRKKRKGVMARSFGKDEDKSFEEQRGDGR
ncbi:unnamed protein product [Lathyrus sativus]|nr:unnamed protein product [Lathyrus sativus]